MYYTYFWPVVVIVLLLMLIVHLMNFFAKLKNVAKDVMPPKGSFAKPNLKDPNEIVKQIYRDGINKK
jgi:hypothetical protein